MNDDHTSVEVIKSQYQEILRRLDSIDGHLEAQNGRVRKLEEWRWKAAGA